MSNITKALALGTSSLLAVGGIAGAVVNNGVEADAPAPNDVAAAEEAVQLSDDTSIVRMPQVDGEFSYVQGEVGEGDDIARVATASKYFCASEEDRESGDVDVLDWTLTVTGAVQNSYSATFEELAANEETKSVVMGCACAGNPVDGVSSSNAEVSGFSVARLIALAEPTEAANTIVFGSADGYEVAIPLDYLAQRLCPLVFDINGYPLQSSIGGVNQLWLGSTPASYFARDVVSVTLEERQTPPPSPNSEEAREAYQNLPNVGVLLGGEIR